MENEKQMASLGFPAAAAVGIRLVHWAINPIIAGARELPAVLISRCIYGVPCRYHGRTHARGHRIGRPALVARLKAKYRLYDICPECDAGMPTPRPPTRIVDGRWICDGEDVTDLFREGAQIALRHAEQYRCERAYLLAGSPACDRDQGATGRCLTAHGLTVIRV